MKLVQHRKVLYCHFSTVNITVFRCVGKKITLLVGFDHQFCLEIIIHWAHEYYNKMVDKLRDIFVIV